MFEASHDVIWEAIRALVKRAIKSGDIRKDLDAIDLLRALIGVAKVGVQPGLAGKRPPAGGYSRNRIEDGEVGFSSREKRQHHVWRAARRWHCRGATLLLMNRICIVRIAGLLILAAAPILNSEASGAEKPDFSGSYAITGVKGGSKSKAPGGSAVQVTQTDTAIEVTKVIDGRSSMNRFKLDGTESPYRSEGGAQGSATARLKGKTLTIDTQVVTRPQANGPAVQIHKKEEWNLSSDFQTLTIRTDVDFPNSGLGGLQLMDPLREGLHQEPITGCGSAPGSDTR